MYTPIEKCYNISFQSEADSIEMKDLRMSPLPVIRNNQNCTMELDDEDKSAPAIRMAPVLPRTCVSRGYVHNNLFRRKNGSSAPKRKKIFANMKQRAKSIKVKLPTVRDVNIIDRYSRLMFPLLFIIFNISYWAFYLLQK